MLSRFIGVIGVQCNFRLEIFGRGCKLRRCQRWCVTRDTIYLVYLAFLSNFLITISSRMQDWQTTFAKAQKFLTFLLTKRKKGNQPTKISFQIASPIKNSRHHSIPPPLENRNGKEKNPKKPVTRNEKLSGRAEIKEITRARGGQVLGRRADSTRGEIGPRIMAV